MRVIGTGSEKRVSERISGRGGTIMGPVGIRPATGLKAVLIPGTSLPVKAIGCLIGSGDLGRVTMAGCVTLSERTGILIGKGGCLPIIGEDGVRIGDRCVGKEIGIGDRCVGIGDVGVCIGRKGVGWRTCGSGVGCRNVGVADPITTSRTGLGDRSLSLGLLVCSLV